MIPPERACCRCLEVKPADDFHTIKRHGKLSLQSYCKPCMTIRSREWREANRDRSRANNRRNKAKARLVDPRRERSHQYKTLYGITLDEYEAMLDAQSGVCAICKSGPGKKRLHVDHDHQTGNVRSLLCSRCNTALGLFDEDPRRLQAAIEYLWTHENQSLDGLSLLNEAVAAISG